jgi:hypothetical protein
METLDKGRIHIQGRMEQDGIRLYLATKTGAQFKTHELFISVIFHLIFSECS